jgi:hypothetical protein
MDKDEALRELAKEWERKGVVGGPPGLWDLALALARKDLPVVEAVDESPAGPGSEDPALPKAE